MLSLTGLDLSKTGCLKKIRRDCSKSPFNPGVIDNKKNKKKIKINIRDIRNLSVFFLLINNFSLQFCFHKENI